MREPPFAIRLFGHPVIAVTTMLGGFGLLCASWQAGNDGLVPGILTLVVLAWVAKASEAMSAYRAWKRAWDAMDDRPHRRLPWRIWGAAAFLVALVLYLIGSAGDAATVAYLRLVAVALGMAAIVATIRALWGRVGSSRPRSSSSGAVTISAQAAPSPNLADAYAALPEHCRQAMGERP